MPRFTITCEVDIEADSIEEAYKLWDNALHNPDSWILNDVLGSAEIHES